MPRPPAQETIHLKPAAPLAQRVLLCGDPQRALAIAQALLREPKMFNTRRGLWGYTGGAGDGGHVTVQSTGMGGPSTAIVCEELISLGAQVFVRLGTCGALADHLELGQLVTVARVKACDGTSQALGAADTLRCDAQLTDALAHASATPRVTAASNDLFYGEQSERIARLVSEGVEVIEMEAAALIQVAARHRKAAACMLCVSDAMRSDGTHVRLDSNALENAGVRLGRAGLNALAQLGVCD